MVISTGELLRKRPGPQNRYALTKQHVDDYVFPGRLRFGLTDLPEIDSTDAQRYVITAVDLQRLDLIAHRFYGDSRLWWAIALVNKIKNPLTDLTIGQVLMIPQKSAIAAPFAEGFA